jgi:hypothetical protein
LKQEKIGKKTLDELCDSEKPVNKLKKSAIQTVNSPLTDDDVVVLGGHSWTVSKACIDESIDNDNVVEDVVVEDVVKGDDELDDEQEEKTASEGTSKKSGQPTIIQLYT